MQRMTFEDDLQGLRSEMSKIHNLNLRSKFSFGTDLTERKVAVRGHSINT